MSTRSVLILALFTGLLATAAPTSADASQIGAGKNLGLGIGGGTMSTTGLTVKSYLTPRTAVQGFLDIDAWRGYGLGADYMWEFDRLGKGSAGELFWGAGIGGAVRMNSGYADNSTGIGIAAVIELGWHFRELPLEIILDLRPGLRFGGYYDYHYKHNYKYGRVPQLITSQAAIRWYF